MVTIRNLILLTLLSVPVIIYAQENAPVTRHYHYATATGEANGKPVLYVSGVVYADFYNEYLPMPDSIISKEMKREFITRLQNDYGDTKTFTFYEYAMDPDKSKVTAAYKTVLADFKKKGYKVVIVKQFMYD